MVSMTTEVTRTEVTRPRKAGSAAVCRRALFRLPRLHTVR